MKKLSLRQPVFVLLLLALSTGFAHAQVQVADEPETEDIIINKDQDKVLKFHLLQPGEIYLSYEKLRSSRISNEFGLGYVYSGFLKGDNWYPDSKRANGVAVRMSQRHYTSKKKDAPLGFFHGPLFGYRFMVFEKNVFGQENLPSNDPNFVYIGRFYENALDLSYLAGTQLMLRKNLVLEIAGGIGGRVKYARAVGAGDLLADRMTGRVLRSERNTAASIVPLPHLNLSIGYAF